MMEKANRPRADLGELEGDNVKKFLVAITVLFSVPTWATSGLIINGPCQPNQNYEGQSTFDTSDKMLMAWRSYNNNFNSNHLPVNYTGWSYVAETISGVSGYVICDPGYTDGDKTHYWSPGPGVACDATHYNVGFCSGNLTAWQSSVPAQDQYPRPQTPQSFVPPINFGGGSGDTETHNLASYQQVMGETTLDGSTTFSSLGSRSGGVTFGLPVQDVPQVNGSAISGLGTAMVDGKPWTVEVTNNAVEFFNSSGTQLSVSNLTNTSTITYHVQYSSSYTSPQSYTFAPTITAAGGGSITTSNVTATYQIEGSKVYFQLSFYVSAFTSGNGWIGFTLPTSSSFSGMFSGVQSSNGADLQGYATSSTAGGVYAVSGSSWGIAPFWVDISGSYFQ